MALRYICIQVRLLTSRRMHSQIWSAKNTPLERNQHATTDFINPFIEHSQYLQLRRRMMLRIKSEPERDFKIVRFSVKIWKKTMKFQLHPKSKIDIRNQSKNAQNSIWTFNQNVWQATVNQSYVLYPLGLVGKNSFDFDWARSWEQWKIIYQFYW